MQGCNGIRVVPDRERRFAGQRGSSRVAEIFLFKRRRGTAQIAKGRSASHRICGRQGARPRSSHTP